MLKGILTEHLSVSVTSVKWICRLGQKRHVKDRPVILKMSNYNDKVTVLRDCRKLKGSPIGIHEEYSCETLYKRKQLWKSAKSIKENWAKFTLIHNKQYVDPC